MDDLKALKAKLVDFEKKLQDLLLSTQEDLSLAEDLQKLLMPNRVPEVAGLNIMARYIPAFQISSESFDVIPTKEGRQVWIITAQTETFGLSSVLLQNMVHLQSQALVESRPKISVEELFNDLSTSLSRAKKAAHYRLLVARIDVSTLQMSGVGIGAVPVLIKHREGAHYENWRWGQADAFALNPRWLEPAFSATPTLAQQAYSFSYHLRPGTRGLIVGSEWLSTAKSLKDFEKALRLDEVSDENQDLLKDLNAFLMQAQEHLSEAKKSCDLSALAFEVDAKKLHLA